MPPGTEWQELKDLCKPLGQVEYAETLSTESCIGYIRYDDPAHASEAAKALNGTKLGGSEICIEMDKMSRDMSRLIIHNVPSGIEWQELKDHFNPIGRVAHAEVKGGKGGKGDKGGKGGKGMVTISQEQMAM